MSDEFTAVGKEFDLSLPASQWPGIGFRVTYDRSQFIKFNKELERAVALAAFDTAQDIVDKARADVRKSSGDIEKSIFGPEEKKVGGKTIWTIGARDPGARYLDTGRPPGRRLPPYKEIAKWVDLNYSKIYTGAGASHPKYLKKRGKNKGQAYDRKGLIRAIRFGVKRRGYIGTYFWQNAVKHGLSRYELHVNQRFLYAARRGRR